METPALKKVRVFRSEEKIFNILDEYRKSNLSIKAFCIENNIASASFHNWKKKYSQRTVKPAKAPGFAALQVTAS
ncbi:MAG TPA: transposase, partial [Chitinophagaceae bacterium]|nr:transposase [Chitinophagaceae bacterium]